MRVNGLGFIILFESCFDAEDSHGPSEPNQAVRQITTKEQEHLSHPSRTSVLTWRGTQGYQICTWFQRNWLQDLPWCRAPPFCHNLLPHKRRDLWRGRRIAVLVRGNIMDYSKICIVHVSKIPGASHADKHHVLPLHTRKVILHSVYCNQVHFSCWAKATQTTGSYFSEDEDQSKDTFLSLALGLAHHTRVLSVFGHLHQI